MEKQRLDYLKTKLIKDGTLLPDDAQSQQWKGQSLGQRVINDPDIVVMIPSRDTPI